MSIFLLLRSKVLPYCIPLIFMACNTGHSDKKQEHDSELVRSGPMPGYAGMREVLLWVQTTKAATVQFQYWIRGEPDQKFTTNKIKTAEKHAYTAKLIADKVMPGHAYQYEVWVNGKKQSFDYPLTFHSQKDWKYKTEVPDIKFATGSCAFINDSAFDRDGDPYGGGYQIFESICKDDPQFMLWLGDNTYLREADWNTRTGIFYRYTDTRSVDAMQPLLAATHHYAIWDDHDYGPNNTDRSFPHKNLSREAFHTFWGNPDFGIEGLQGCTNAFTWADCQFLMLDNRWYRTPNHCDACDCTVLGDQQIEWFIDRLIYSRAPFKFVAIGGQVLNTVKRYETYANLCPEERKRLLERIQEENIRGVVFLTGDRHHSELSKYEGDTSGPHIYDLTISPLTSGAYDAANENNELRVEGTHVGVRNYGILNITGPRKARKLIISVKDQKGEQKWQKTIMASEWDR